jgi:threonine/homoserine/homoserine lactone efflux protein
MWSWSDGPARRGKSEAGENRSGGTSRRGSASALVTQGTDRRESTGGIVTYDPETGLGGRPCAIDASSFDRVRREMGMDGLVGFVLGGFALAGSPGPNTLSLAAAGAAFGARRGLGYLAGLVVGMIGVMTITASGLAGLLFAIPGARPVVFVMALAYFAYLAWRIAMAPPLANEVDRGAAPTFPGGVLLSLVNPKAYAAMAAVFSGFVLVDGALAIDAIAKTAVMTVVIVAVNVAWLFAGAALTRFFRDPAANRAINIGFAAALVLSVVAAFLL